MRSLKDAVITDYPSRFKPDEFPASQLTSSREANQLLDHLQPTHGNLAPSESWRRMLGGRKRYNWKRQQTAKARRNAIFIWLMQNRTNLFDDVFREWTPIDWIIVRHGDGAMLAKALGVGKATVCRDLSALQATQPRWFGSNTCEVGYDEYMAGWKYAHRTGMGDDQPHHNLRFPKNQHGPAARDRNVVASMFGQQAPSHRCSSSKQPDSQSETDSETGGCEATVRSVEVHLTLLRQNCPEDELAPPGIRHPLPLWASIMA